MSTGLSTRSTVLTSTDPGEKTLKPKSIPGTKSLSKGTEGEWSFIQPEAIPGTKTLSKGPEGEWSFIHAQLKEIK